MFYNAKCYNFSPYSLKTNSTLLNNNIKFKQNTMI